MQLRILLLPILLLAACAPESKYPYPPQYVSAEDVPPVSIPAPPRKGSPEYAKEVDQIVAIQSKLTPAQIKTIQDQITIKPEVIVLPVLGAKYTAAQYPKLYDMLNRVASDAWRIGDTTRFYWNSPRPWYAEPRVKRHVEVILTPGYPSGHTTTFGSWAYVLGDLFPGKREELLDFAWSVGGNRIAGGAHYPHDIAGGKLLSKAVYDALQTDENYIKTIEAVRDELAFSSVKLKPGMVKSAADTARPTMH